MASTHAMGGAWCGPDPEELRSALRRAFAAASAWQGHHRHHGGMPGKERHRGGPRGPWPFPFDFGKGFFGPGFGGGWARRHKAKRGDVRAAILALLREGPRNGYQIIQEIAERSHGGWKPSPGAVYPALQQLTDEGLIRAEESDGKKTFRLTDAGRAYVEAHPEEVDAPWEEMRPDVDDTTWELFDVARQSAFAMMQILQTGSDAQIRQARQTLAETRRKLYQILADGDPTEE